MNLVLDYFRNLPRRQVVRPWALAVPILVLLVALPLLRPLRNPNGASSNELSRLAQIQSLAENHTQEISGSVFFPIHHGPSAAEPSDTIQLGDKHYSDKPPVLSVLLAGAYLVMQRFGLTFEDNQALVIYVLTIIGSVIPVASSAGMIYRMGRLFELRRPLRTALALAVTFGSGLISYAVVINAHAPAAALVLGACACLVHITVVKEPTRTGAWLIVSGFCAALAATIDPAAIVFLVGLVFVIVALRWRKRLRVGGTMLYVIGALPPIVLHAVLMVPITGDLLPPNLHFEMRNPGRALVIAARDPDDDPAPASGWARAIGASTERAVIALVGSRGILSHFPVLIVGVFGIALVLRRHWPIATKTMAAISLVGSVAIVLASIIVPADWSSAMFGPRWFIVFLPLMLFWSGAWIRKRHHPATWAVAALLLIFSIGVSLIGATAPFIKSDGRYTAAAALRQLLHPAPPALEGPVIASN